MKKNHAARKQHQPKRKPQDLEFFMFGIVRKIRAAYIVPVRITVAVRVAGNTDAEVVFSDDDMDGLIDMLQRRKAGVMAAQAKASEPVTDDDHAA